MMESGMGNRSVVSILDFHPVSRGSNPGEKRSTIITISIQELS